MKVLAFDCSGEVLSVAVRDGGSWAEASLDFGLRHAERLMDLVDRCLAWAGIRPAELGLIACTIGPGSFTGLRIGISTAKGMALGLGVPWVGVPSLDCLAWGHEANEGPVAPIMDARRGRVYSAIYLRGRRISDWLDLPLAELAALLDTYPQALVTGPDAELFEPYAADRSGFRIDPRARQSAARALAVLGEARFAAEGGAKEDAGPLYLRPVEADRAGPPPGAGTTE
ncbi:MAG TPA: tRNA (adenosine(37)-N6)-threonylcarbamoyltransferase complex dimerization subunit type 1 TsaB [Rectinemataceae bacterium]|nr:tRNA (adenosine(37)-N6)-threonylcarbamoyltransferase complex dimerization subunit type 1 TsaB [Rectinemataceae bacterium]